MRIRFEAGLFATAMLLPIAAHAQNTGLEDLVGARAGQAEGELERRGYAYVDGRTGDDRKWSNWWSDRRGQCVSIATVNGRYDSIVPTPAPDCRRQGGRPDTGYRPDDWSGGRPVSLGLVCFGEGQKPAAANRWGWQWNWKTGRYDFGNRTELTTRQFDTSVMIQIWDGGGRIRLPKSLVPPIHASGSRDGWWDLYDVFDDPGTIRATYRLNGPNKPRVTIDRRSGRITIKGFANYGFRGSCDTIDGARHNRF